MRPSPSAPAAAPAFSSFAPNVSGRTRLSTPNCIAASRRWRWKKRDPIATFTARLRQQNLVDDGALAALESEVAREIEEATAFAEAGHLEPVEDLTRFVYSEPSKEGVSR